MYDLCRHAHTQHVHVHAQIMQHRWTKELSCDKEPPRGRGIPGECRASSHFETRRVRCTRESRYLITMQRLSSIPLRNGMYMYGDRRAIHLHRRATRWLHYFPFALFHKTSYTRVS